MEDPAVLLVQPMRVAARWRGLDTLAQQVMAARHACEVMCGLASELEVYPQFERMPGIQPYHSRGLIPLSYHITDAMGALHMLRAGVERRSVWLLLTACLESAEAAIREMEGPLGEMRSAAARTEAAEQVLAVERWSRQCGLAVRRAREVLRAVLAAEAPRVEAEAREFTLRAYAIRHAGRPGAAGESAG